jgi:hypothetical protein
MLSKLADNGLFAGAEGALSQWLLLAGGLAAVLAAVALFVFLVRRIDYRIGPRHLKVTLFGIPLRRLRLDNIRHISTHRPFFCERWQNQVLLRRDRVLVIEKRRGLIRCVLITPEQRFVFKAALDRAIRAANGLPPAPTVADRMVAEEFRPSPGPTAAVSPPGGAPPAG